MPLDDGFNVDSRNRSQAKSVARGDHKGNGTGSGSVTLNITDTETSDTQQFWANGKFIGFLIEIGALDGTSATLDVEIFPADATNANAAIFSESLTLARNDIHLVWIQDEVTGNHVRYLFGEHKVKVTSSNAAASGGGADIKFIPILGKH